MSERHLSTNIEQELVKYQKRAAKYKEKNVLLNKALRRAHQRHKEINVSRNFWKGRFKTLQAEKGQGLCQNLSDNPSRYFSCKLIRQIHTFRYILIRKPFVFDDFHNQMCQIKSIF